MGFQIILSIFIIIAIIRLFVQFYKKKIDLIFFLFFLTIWCGVYFLNWNNPILNRMGSILGIARGATILVYIGLFLIFYYIFVSITKFYKIERDIDKIIREYALKDFVKKYNIADKENSKKQ